MFVFLCLCVTRTSKDSALGTRGVLEQTVTFKLCCTHDIMGLGHICSNTFNPEAILIRKDP